MLGLRECSQVEEVGGGELVCCKKPMVLITKQKNSIGKGNQKYKMETVPRLGVSLIKGGYGFSVIVAGPEEYDGYPVSKLVNIGPQGLLCPKISPMILEMHRYEISFIVYALDV